MIGTIESITERDWKNGLKFYHFKLEGSPIVYNCKTAKPEVTEGDTISFNEKNRVVDTSTIKPANREEVECQSQDTNGSESNSGAAPSTPTTATNDVGARIRWQEARRDAVRIVTTAMETGLLPYPKSGKAQDKWDRMLDLINETTNDLLEQEDGTWNRDK